VKTYATAPDGTRYIDSDFLLAAYSGGYFPMAAGPDGEISWYAPEERGIIPLDGVIVSRSLRRTLRSGTFDVRIDTDFAAVIRACAERPEVWISRGIIESYLRLHRLGFAHSVECWHEGTLAGGLYGVAIGGAFFGESMFSRRTDASKVALVRLTERLTERGYTLLDTQYLTPHLASLGGVAVPKREYLRRLDSALRLERTFV